METSESGWERAALQLARVDVPKLLITRLALYPVSQTEVTWKMPESADTTGVGLGIGVGVAVG